MEDDQEAQYESPSERGYHDYNNISPWEDQGSLAAGDTNSNRNTNQGDDGSGGLCIKIKGNSGAAHDNNEHHPRVCHICNKGFSSGKALGGHMRMHALSSKQAQNKAKEGSHVSKPNNNTWVLVGGSNPTCYLCTKSFPSMKSLFGHMRSHPERVWRGIQPPSSTTPNEVASSNSTSSSTLSDDSAVDLSRALWGWSVTAKRGRKSLSCCNTDSGFKHGVEVEQRMQEAVYELMLLAHGDPKTVLECEDTSKRKKKLAGDDQVELSSVSFKIEEKSLNKMGYEEEDSDSESDSQNSDGSTVGTDMKNGNKNSNKKKKKGTKKMKLNEIGTAEQGNKLDNGTAKRYRCSICNKSFPSHQALGGHLSSHKKSKKIQITDESESRDVLAAEDQAEEHHAKTTTMQGDETETVVEGLLGCSSTMEVMSGHQCNICNKTFSTGQGCQARGGHKRSHWTVMAEAQSAPATSPVENGQNRPKVLSFDLNQLPAMDEEEDCQSDLFFPTNIVASSPYASFSQNSVTN